MIKKIFVLSVLALMLALMFGCAAEKGKPDITIAVAIVPEAAFVQRITNGEAAVVTLIPPGMSPANYSPSAAEMQKFSEANVYFTLQMPAEQANILPKALDFNKDIVIVDLREAVSAQYPMLEGADPDSPGVDPHIWLSPKRAAVMAAAMADELCTLYPERADAFRANAQELVDEINALDSEIRDKLSSLKNRTFIMYHGAYGYFADDYGLEMVAIEAEGKQATAAEMQQVIAMAKEQGIKTVFYQEEFSDVQAKTVAEEIRGSVVKTAPLSENYIENLRAFADALTEADGK